MVINNKRIIVVDALRGFALVSIMLLHNIEMFEVYASGPALPDWIVQLDKVIWDTFFFLFGGKSYAIFALLFGLTYYIQFHNQEEKGKDFSWRFIWRMVLLLGFGFINTLFYRGEILVLYAVLGVLLVPFRKLSDKAIVASAIVFLLQPLLTIRFFKALQYPGLEPAEPSFMPYYIRSGEYLTGSSLPELMLSNITDGRIASLLWYWENGRIEQTLALFLLGYLGGRKRIFYGSVENLKLWRRVLLVSAVLFVPLFFLKENPEVFTNSENIAARIGPIIGLWSNLAFMLVLTASFILLFYTKKVQPILNKLSPIGKMSLTNYILQSIVGATLYYGFGFAIYQYIGTTYCLLIGVGLAIGMGLFSSYWMNKHKRGLFEHLWHTLTWVGTRKS